MGTHNLEFNPKHVEKFGTEELDKIIKHELCHYHLHLMGKGYKHGDRDFRELLYAVGGTRFCKSVQEKEKSRVIAMYCCVHPVKWNTIVKKEWIPGNMPVEDAKEN